MKFKPMRACDGGLDVERFTYPLYASLKLDGIRATIQKTGVMSKSLKRIPNLFVQKELKLAKLLGLDGELVVGELDDPNLIQKTTSGIMSIKGEPDFSFYVFDKFGPGGYHDRFCSSVGYTALGFHPRLRMLPQLMIEGPDELLRFEQDALQRGLEGVMLRSVHGHYKEGTSTFREGYLMKLKRVQDSEAIIIGFEEKMHNTNPAQTNELGKTKRSSAKAGLVGAGTLGNFLVRNMDDGVEFSCAPGRLTDPEKQAIWDSRKKYLGKLITYKHFAQTGVKDKPRNPRFKCFRDKRDL